MNGTTVGTQYTEDNVTGSVNLNADNGSGASLNVALGYAGEVGDQFVIINDLGGPVTGAFAGLAQGATGTAHFGATTYSFAIDYAGGNGNEVVLTLQSSSNGGNTADVYAGGLDFREPGHVHRVRQQLSHRRPG